MHRKRDGRATRRSLGLTAASAMALAVLPVGAAAADEDGSTEPRDTARVCHGEYESSFEDVEDNVHLDAILCAADYGIASGHPDDTFRPANLVERDQMASFIARWVEAATDEELPTGDGDVDDVDADNVHRVPIHKLTTADIALGFDDETYGPDQAVERDQMASFIARALSYIDDGDAENGSAPPAADQGHFTDVEGDNPHRLAIDALAEQGIVAGYEGADTYGPDDGVRRDQMTAFIMRAYDFAAAQLIDPDPDPEPVEVTIDAPTAADPYPGVEQGAEIDITFTSSHECDFAFHIRAIDADDPDEWLFVHDGVTPEGEGLVDVTVPEEAAPGYHDLRVTCPTETHGEDTATEEGAIEIVEAADDDE